MDHISPELLKTITKVRQLLALSQGGTTENEVKAAATAADRIMQEHRITQAMLESAGTIVAEPMVSKVVSEGGRRTAWREVLLHALTVHYGCAWCLSSRRSWDSETRSKKHGKGRTTYTVMGQQSDTEIVAYMFTHLEGEIERLCRWHAGGKGVKFAMAWLMGCAEGVALQFSMMRAATRAQAETSSSTALAILDKRGEAASKYMSERIGTKAAKSVHGAQDYDARREGREVGKSIQIRQGLSAGTPAAKLGC